MSTKSMPMQMDQRTPPPSSGSAQFPSLIDKYKVAIETHRHYDTLSLSVIAGVAALPIGFLSAKWPSFIPYIKFASPLLFLISELLLFCIYINLSWYATIARNVATALETKDGPGISEVYGDINKYPEYHPKTGIKPRISIKRTVYACFFAILLIALALVLQTRA